ncbi:MAG: DNA-3-methyladenine glycosylase 2 family protein [Candidatus Binataceae bacterium]
MELSREACYQVIQARDRRFDGRLFTAVRTTGIYCRPICPARVPKLENIVFFPSAAAAHAAGFRPCLRCRPECSPDLAASRGTSSSIARALKLIADGALDGDCSRVESLARRLGVGQRHLRRLFTELLGASPIEVAQTRRVLFAKQLIHETRMSMVDIAMAAGFGSLRRFNATFRNLYARPPGALRRKRSKAKAEDRAGITLTLSYAAPYDWPAMIGFLAARAIAGVEVVEPNRYRRTVEVAGLRGTIEVRPMRGRDALAASIHFPGAKELPAIVARIRRVFDLGADIATISAELSKDPWLAPLVAARPGLRVAGAWDGFELAVRAILGQQITVTAARHLAGKLAAAYGDPLSPDSGSNDCVRPELTRIFPRPEILASADLTKLGIPRARATALSALAAAAAADSKLFLRYEELDAATARLKQLPGIGEWTAQYIAMRAMREPDAFPAADIGLLRAMGRSSIDGVRPSPAALLIRAQAWRPWRAYAAQHLWTWGAATSDSAKSARAKYAGSEKTSRSEIVGPANQMRALTFSQAVRRGDPPARDLEQRDCGRN